MRPVNPDLADPSWRTLWCIHGAEPPGEPPRPFGLESPLWPRRWAPKRQSTGRRSSSGATRRATGVASCIEPPSADDRLPREAAALLAGLAGELLGGSALPARLRNSRDWKSRHLDRRHSARGWLDLHNPKRSTARPALRLGDPPRILSGNDHPQPRKEHFRHGRRGALNCDPLTPHLVGSRGRRC
jgi:hypothetical protein